MEAREAYRAPADKKAVSTPTVKSEVHQLIDSINAMGHGALAKKITAQVECYGCGGKGHFRRDCPRATSGLTTNVVLDELDDLEDPEDLTEEGQVNHLRQGRPFRRNPPKKNGTRGYSKKVHFRGRRGPGRVVAQLVETEDGQLEILSADPEDEVCDEDAHTDAVHFLA